MTRHPISYEELIAYAAGRLDPEQTAKVEEHIRQCIDCQETVGHFRQVEYLVRDDDGEMPQGPVLGEAYALFEPPAISSQPTSRWQRLARLFRPARLAPVSLLAALVLAVLLFFGGVEMLAPVLAETLPGDAFYPVKTTVEDVQLAVSTDNASRVQVELAIVHARVTELDKLVTVGRYDEIPKTTQDLQTHVLAVTTTVSQVVKKNPSQAPLAQKVVTDLNQYSTKLETLQQTSPSSIQPLIHQALSSSQAAQSDVTTQLGNMGVTVAPAPTAHFTAVPTAAGTNPTTGTSLQAGTGTPVSTPSLTNTPQSTVVPTVVAPAAGTATATATDLPTPTAAPSPTVTPTATATATQTPTATATISPTATQTPTSRPTRTRRPTRTPPPTLTPTLTPTPPATLVPSTGFVPGH